MAEESLEPAQSGSIGISAAGRAAEEEMTEHKHLMQHTLQPALQGRIERHIKGEYCASKENSCYVQAVLVQVVASPVCIWSDAAAAT